MISMQQFPFLRLLLNLPIMMLDMPRYWLHWVLCWEILNLFSGRSVLSKLKLSSASSISKSVSITIIWMRIDWFCFGVFDLFWDNFYFPVLDFCKTFITLDFTYSVYPCPVETLRESICGFPNTLFTLCPFETKRGNNFCFGLGMYF